MEKDTRKVTARKEKKTTATLVVNCELRFRLPRWRKKKRRIFIESPAALRIVMWWSRKGSRKEDGEDGHCVAGNLSSWFTDILFPVFCLAYIRPKRKWNPICFVTINQSVKTAHLRARWSFKIPRGTIAGQVIVFRSARNITDRGFPSTNNAMPHVRRERTRLQINLQSALQ